MECAICHKLWNQDGSPAIHKECGKTSYPIARWKGQDTDAKAIEIINREWEELRKEL